MAIKNYLLFVPSLLNDGSGEIFYKGAGVNEVLTGIQTNEAATKYVIALLQEQGVLLDKIIMLCTKEVREVRFPFFGNMTTLEFYKSSILTFMKSKGVQQDEELFAPLEFNPNENDNVNEILKPLKGLIDITVGPNEDEKRIFFDSTGGTRSAAFALYSALQLMQNSGVKVEKVLYSNLAREIGAQPNSAEHPAKIDNVTKTYDTVLLLLGRVQQKMGVKATGLNDYCAKYDLKEAASVVNEADEFSEKMRAGATETIKEEAKRGREQRAEAIKKAREEEDVVTETLVRDLTEEIGLENIPESELNMHILKRHSDNGNTLLAFTHCREKAVQILYDFGILSQPENKRDEPLDVARITNELFANYYYYSTGFLAYAKNFIRLLLQNTSTAPAGIFREEDWGLSRHLNRTPCANFASTPYMDKYFENHCANDTKELKNEMTEQIMNLLEQSPPNLPEAIIGVVNVHMKKVGKLKNIYFSSGFPFPNVYNRTYIMFGYDGVYKAVFKRALEALGALYNHTSDCARHHPILRTAMSFSKEAATGYEELLRLALEDDACLRALFPIALNKYSIVPGGNRKPYQVSAFLQEFMPVFVQVKELRNLMVHKNGVPPPPKTLEQAKVLIERIVEIIEEEKGVSA